MYIHTYFSYLYCYFFIIIHFDDDDEDDDDDDDVDGTTTIKAIKNSTTKEYKMQKSRANEETSFKILGRKNQKKNVKKSFLIKVR